MSIPMLSAPAGGRAGMGGRNCGGFPSIPGPANGIVATHVTGACGLRPRRTNARSRAEEGRFAVLGGVGHAHRVMSIGASIRESRYLDGVVPRWPMCSTARGALRRENPSALQVTPRHHRIGQPGTVIGPPPQHHRLCRSTDGGSRGARKALMVLQKDHESHVGERSVGECFIPQPCRNSGSCLAFSRCTDLAATLSCGFPSCRVMV